jgi:hypothetical protein
MERERLKAFKEDGGPMVLGAAMRKALLKTGPRD